MHWFNEKLRKKQNPISHRLTEYREEVLTGFTGLSGLFSSKT
jgi:hypothetical protein